MNNKKTPSITDFTTFTYSISADSCQSRPRVEYHRDDLTFDEALRLADSLHYGFRKVEIICNDTGEVCYTKYFAEEFFNQTLSYHESIGLAEFTLDQIRTQDDKEVTK